MVLPKLSIITINYNNLAGLKKTFDSVLNQTYQDFEYVVIDGGSSDGSKELIKQNSDKISCWVSEPDNGIYNAMNKGIKAANGEYLLFLNSGDEFFDESILFKVVPLLDKDIVYGDILTEYFGRNIILTPPSLLDFNYFFYRTLPHQSTLIKRNLFSIVGYYDEKLKVVSDFKFFILAICRHQCSYKKIDFILTKQDYGGVSSLPENQHWIEAERKLVLKDSFITFVENYKEYNQLKTLIKSRQIQWLRKLGLFRSYIK